MNYLVVAGLLLFGVSSYADPTNDCFKQAKTTTVGLAIQLCQGATSNWPATCFEQAWVQGSQLTQGMAVRLCRGATSDAPLKCYKNAQGMTVGQAVSLCSTKGS